MPNASPRDTPALVPWRWPLIRLRPALTLFGLFVLVGLALGSAVRLAQLAESSKVPWPRPFLWELTGVLGAWLALPVVQTAVLNAPGPRVGWARFLGLHGVSFLLFSAVHILWMLGSRNLLYPLLGWGTYDYGPLAYRVPMEMAKDVVFYVGAAFVSSIVEAWQERQARTLHAVQLEAELRAAQLQSLTGQLNPHFLFNALNTVSAVMYEDLRRTDRLLSDLGQLLRASLDSAGPTWTLAEERAHVQRFLELLDARFGERLRVGWEVAPGVESAAVPRFALQTLVENAVKHNQDRSAPLEVRIRAGELGSTVRLEVEDTGRGFGEASPASGPGVGLSHLARILMLLHGERAHLERGQGPEGGARVALHFPREVA
ncbi:MAG: histidine kinase [Myxococcaceae bacterium]|nr:histidine kinase [Myxococcaceae bacterium]